MKKFWLLACGLAVQGMSAQELESRLTWGEASLNPAVEWREYATRETQWLRYQRLQGYLQGLPIEGAEALRVVKPDGSMALLVEPILPDQPAGTHTLASTPDPVWLVVGMQWIPAERRESYRASPLKRVRTWYDQSGRAIDSLDLIRRWDSWDTTIASKVYLPDPLSVANVPYGGQYVDSNDGNAAVLDQVQSLVGLKLTWNGAGFVLANSAAVVQEFDPPTVAVPILPGPTAFFSRSDAEFEMVNALYHIYQWKQRMANLGYPSMVSYPIPIDVNAYNGADLSAFDYGTNPPKLYFGEGGVDDAEDADVVIHEYGHAMAYGAAPGTNINTQRQALEEAICDYFAVSWSLVHSPNRWQNVFTWDGHNEFWNGRSAINSQLKMYPGLLFTGPYSHTTVMVDALVRGRQRLGGTIMDGLVMEALYGLTSGTTFRQFAELVLHADSVKHNGQHAAGLRLDFAAWQILIPGLGNGEVSIDKSSDAIILSNGLWPDTLPQSLRVRDAMGRELVLEQYVALPAAGWYLSQDGRRILVTP